MRGKGRREGKEIKTLSGGERAFQITWTRKPGTGSRGSEGSPSSPLTYSPLSFSEANTEAQEVRSQVGKCWSAGGPQSALCPQVSVLPVWPLCQAVSHRW